MNIPIIADIAYEGDENFQLEIIAPEEAVAAGIIDGCPSLTVEITEDNCKLYNS